MNKIILTLVVCFTATVYAMAGSDLKVTQGDKKFFKTASGTAVMELIFDNATFDDKMPLAQNEKFKDMDNVKKISAEAFKGEFNKKVKNVSVIDDVSSAKYKFTFNISKMDQYFKVMGFIPSPATKVYGTLTITDNATGEVLVVINVDGADGGANPSPDGTIEDCFRDLAKQMAKLK